jgi:hypothetical protein
MNTLLARNGFEYCPLCGQYSKNPAKPDGKGGFFQFLVCKACDDRYKAYSREIAAKLIRNPNQNLTVLSKSAWIISQLEPVILALEKKWQEAQKMRENPEARIDQRVKSVSTGKNFSVEILESLWTEAKKQISGEDYALVVQLNAQLKATKQLRQDLEKLLSPEPV